MNVGSPVTVFPAPETVNDMTICVQLTLTSDLSVGADGSTMVPDAKVAVGISSSQVSTADTVTEKPVALGAAYCVVVVPGSVRLFCMNDNIRLIDALRVSPLFVAQTARRSPSWSVSSEESWLMLVIASIPCQGAVRSNRQRVNWWTQERVVVVAPALVALARRDRHVAKLHLNREGRSGQQRLV